MWDPASEAQLLAREVNMLRKPQQRAASPQKYTGPSSELSRKGKNMGKRQPFLGKQREALEGAGVWHQALPLSTLGPWAGDFASWILLAPAAKVGLVTRQFLHIYLLILRKVTSRCLAHSWHSINGTFILGP